MDETSYDLEAMKRHVSRRRDNIALFEKTIEQEQAAIKRELQVIRMLEEKPNAD